MFTCAFACVCTTLHAPETQKNGRKERWRGGQLEVEGDNKLISKMECSLMLKWTSYIIGKERERRRERGIDGERETVTKMCDLE